MNYTPRYTSIEQVKQVLAGKVAFGSSPDEVSDNELLNIIEDAEAQLNVELSRQYTTPLVAINMATGSPIPLSDIEFPDTLKQINKMATLLSALYLLETYFGDSEGVRGGKFIEQYQKRYDRVTNTIYGKDDKSGQYWNPPLKGLLLNPEASYYLPGIPAPRTARIGIRSGSYGQQVQVRLINGISNWWYRGYWFGTYRGVY